MRRWWIVVGLSALASVGCGDDDDVTHDHEPSSEAGGGSGGRAGKGGSAAAGKGGSAAGKGGTAAAGKGGSAGGTGGTAAAGKGGSAAGKGGSGGAPSTGEESVTIRFKAKVGSEDFACGRDYAGVGSKKSTITPLDFRFFVEDIKLVDGDKEVPVKLKGGSKWQSTTVALLDFEDGTGSCAEGNAETNLVVEGTVPKGDYSAIVFSNGVPDKENHADPVTLSDPLKTYANLSWGWLFGFRFMKAETLLKTDPADLDAGVEVPMSWLHLGAGGCSNMADADGGVDFEQPPVSCTRPSINRIRLDGYKVGASVIVADLAAVFTQTDVSITQGCHGSGDVCVPMWKALGLDAQGKALDEQSVYRLE